MANRYPVTAITGCAASSITGCGSILFFVSFPQYWRSRSPYFPRFLVPVFLHKGSQNSRSIPERIQQTDFTGWLVIVPTKRRIRHLTREIIQTTPAKIAPPLPVHTIETLAAGLFRVTSQRRLLQGATQTLLLHKALLASKNRLRYFSLRKRAPHLHRGTFEKIVNVINRMKETGIYPSQLRDEIDLADRDEFRKLEDITTIYEQYESELDAVQAVDPAGVIKSLSLDCTSERFEAAFRTQFPQVESVTVSGFDEFTGPELGLVAKLSSLPGLSVALEFDYMHGNPALFGQLEENYRRFVQLGFVPAAHSYGWISRRTTADPQRSAEARERVTQTARRLFMRGRSGDPGDLSQYITVIKARNRIEEVEAVCTLLKRLIIEQPQRELSRMCVSMRHPSLYTPLLRAAFAKFGIPANITDRYELAGSPLVVGILDLLRLVARGFRREDIMRVTRSPYARAAGILPTGCDDLFSVALRIRVPAGWDTWMAALDKEIEHNRGQTGPQEVGDFARLTSARSTLDTIRRLLQPLQESCPPVEFQSRFLHLLDELQIHRVLAAPAPFGSPEQHEEEVKAFSRLLETVDDTLKLIAYEDGEGTPHHLDHYLEYFRVAIADQRYNIREQFGRGVLVTSIEETRGLPMDVMVVIGLVDGEFPSVYQPEIFLSRARQAKRSLRHTWEHRYLFYQAFSNFSGHLYLTHPELDGELELVRSTFLDALEAVATVEHMDAVSCISGDTLYSREDVLVSLGQLVHRETPSDIILPPDVSRQLGYVHHSILVEQSRMHSHTMGEYEGAIGDAVSSHARDRLRRLGDQVFSVSQLESYGKCPFQFFSGRLLKLRSVEERDDQLSPLERGDVLHDILFHFFLSRRSLGLPPIQGCSDLEYDEAVRELLGLARGRFSTLDIPDPFWDIEKELWLGHDDAHTGMLREFLTYERQRSTPLEPSFFEVSFGHTPGSTSHADPLMTSSTPIPAGRIRLRGRVDRVDTGRGLFAIIDYKTGGTIPGLEAMRSGISLQLPLYLHAMEHLLRTTTNTAFVPGAGLYYQLRNGIHLKPGIASNAHRGVAFERTSRSRQVLKDDGELRAFIGDAIARAESYVGLMTAGIFPLTTSDKTDKVCGFCAFKTICRIQSAHHVQPQEEDQP